jgi:hypothetical protein
MNALDWPIARDLNEFQRMISAAWRYVETLDGEVSRPRVHRCKLHDDHMIVAVEIGEKRLTVAVPVGAFKSLLN